MLLFIVLNHIISSYDYSHNDIQGLLMAVLASSMVCAFCKNLRVQIINSIKECLNKTFHVFYVLGDKLDIQPVGMIKI